MRILGAGTENMHGIQLGSMDYLPLFICFAFVLGIGLALKRYTKTSTDFFLIAVVNNLVP